MVLPLCGSAVANGEMRSSGAAPRMALFGPTVSLVFARLTVLQFA